MGVNFVRKQHSEQKIFINCRLKQLKREEFLTKRIFTRLSENMHYEVLKYLDCYDLLEMKGVKLGGYQLISNKKLRSRIKNYFFTLYPKLASKEVLDAKCYYRKIQLIFEQTGNDILNFHQMRIGEEGIKKLLPILKLIPNLKGIQLGTDF